jgi:DNA-binding MarR family transcriptional regulator
MSLMDLIEKLINEHGSFKEHLELLREQISMLEKENNMLKSENAILKGKGDTAESKLNKATKEIERLSESVKVPAKDGIKPGLDPVTEKVLKLFFDKSRDMSVKEVAGALSVDIGTAQYHFDLLLKNNLIIQTGIDSTSLRSRENAPFFELTLAGREYVVKNILK